MGSEGGRDKEERESPSMNRGRDQILPPPRCSRPHCIFKGGSILIHAHPIPFTLLRETG